MKLKGVLTSILAVCVIASASFHMAAMNASSEAVAVHIDKASGVVMDAPAVSYRAEFAPAVLADGQLEALNPALIERMHKQNDMITLVQMTSGAQYRVRCKLDGDPASHSSCSWLFRVGIWLED